MEKNTAQNKIAYLYAQVLKASLSTREKLHGFHFNCIQWKVIRKWSGDLYTCKTKGTEGTELSVATTLQFAGWLGSPSSPAVFPVLFVLYSGRAQSCFLSRQFYPWAWLLNWFGIGCQSSTICLCFLFASRLWFRLWNGSWKFSVVWCGRLCSRLCGFLFGDKFGVI